MDPWNGHISLPTDKLIRYLTQKPHTISSSLPTVRLLIFRDMFRFCNMIQATKLTILHKKELSSGKDEGGKSKLEEERENIL